MPDVDALRETLEAARSDLLAQVEPLAEPALTPSLADLLWQLGRDEDWRRRVLSHALEDRAAPPPDERLRPAYLTTPALLAEWLRQSRRALLTVLRDLQEADLDRPLEGLDATARTLLKATAARDHEVAAQLRALPATGGGL